MPRGETMQPEKAQAICSAVADGKSLRTAAKENGISHTAFLLWCREDEALANQYARARETGTDAEFEDLADLQAEAPERDQHGKVDPGWVAWKRLQVDTKKWALSKKAPRKYGEKAEVSLSGEIGIRKIERVIRDA